MLDAPVLSVTDLNKTANHLLSQYFDECLVEGEISELKQYRSGHMYFTLKDASATIRCVLFRGSQFGLKFLPQNGDQVIVSAKLNIYQERGDLQLIINKLELNGQGQLQQQFLKLKAELDKAGLFASAHKLSLPEHPQHLGIISSTDGAALQDILKVLRRRQPMLPITVYATQVQGTQAPKQLLQAVKAANLDQHCDVLILARGGGSIEDLWAFNDKNLAQAIYNSTIPIIAGIGHETDFTIADYVADLRAATPSTAAEIVSLNQTELLTKLDNIAMRLINLMHQKLNSLEHKLVQSNTQLQHLSPSKKLQQSQIRLAHAAELLHKVIHNKLQAAKLQLSALAGKLDLVSPLATLQRGFAIVQDTEQSLVKSIDQVNIKANLTITLQDGHLDCQVQHKAKKTLF